MLGGDNVIVVSYFRRWGRGCQDDGVYADAVAAFNDVDAEVGAAVDSAAAAAVVIAFAAATAVAILLLLRKQ